MTTTAQHRERLQGIRERARSARSARARARETLDAARALNDQDAIAVAALAVEQASLEVETSEQLENMLLAQMAGADGNGFGSPSVFDDPQTIETLQRLGSSSMPVGRLDLGPLSSREDLVASIQSGRWHQGRQAAAGDVTVPDSARVGPYYGTVPQLRRPLRLLDLISTSTMDGKSFGYMQEGGSFDTAAEVAEGQIKATGELVLTEAECVAKTIAHWVKLLRAQLDDTTSLATIVNQRLQYGVLRRLENQIVSGDGVGENLLGILNTAGIGDVAFADGTPLTDLSLDAIVAVIVEEAVPNAVLLNPADLAAMLKEKTAAGQRLDSDGAFGAPPATMWGLPAITSTVMPAGQALVGDWTTGATLFVREQVNIRMSDADQDDFVRNRVTVLGEGRFGLAVWSPASFCVVHFAATAPLRSGKDK